MTAPHPHELLVIRHGQTEWNAAARWQGHRDSPLTAAGEAQARALGRWLGAQGSRFAHPVWSSDQGRARQTAALIAEEAGWCGPIAEDARLREIDVGAWTGRTRAEIIAERPEAEDLHFLDLYAMAPGGESFEALEARCAAFLSGLTGPAVIVTHGITSRVLRTLAMGWGMDRLDELPGGQGVIHRLAGGVHEEIFP